MIALFSDFGLAGPYTGQVRAVIHARAPGVPVVDLMADAPAYRIRAAAHLLAALVAPFPEGSVFLCVVDPGVGTDRREPVFYRVDGRWFVGPGNGLFDVVAARGRQAEAWRVDWRPERLSRSFHGRDLFAPVAAMLATGETVPATRLALEPETLAPAADDLPEILYLDGFGNAISGIRGDAVSDRAVIAAAGRRLDHAPTFGAVDTGDAFWYRNALGLVEIAVNQGSAAAELGLEVGDAVEIEAA
ncbi:MAG: SAM-dependent chlorinase/fluorinase [Gammaproteobacteria bacterium]|nr:SAM-dependent chlorinase/fluorinase [Gammaproteobacteria bacterium]